MKVAIPIIVAVFLGTRAVSDQAEGFVPSFGFLNRRDCRLS
jgi:hypothetical protein